MSEVASFLPEPPADGLFDYVVTYLDADGKRQTYELRSKAAPNALASFSRAVRGHGRILGLRKVVAQ